MFGNHLKTSLRTLKNKKFYSFINIVGLALGLVAAIFIWQYVTFEKSYDKFHQDADRIFRLATEFRTTIGQDDSDAMNAAPVGPALLAELPEVEAFVRITPEYGRTVFKYDEKQFEEGKVFYTDSNFLEFFDYELLHGDKTTALTQPFSVVLTKSIAEHYFGLANTWESNPVGKTLRVNNVFDCTVTGIVQDPPENTHFKFNALVSFKTFLITNGDPTDQWEWNDFYTYVLIKDPKKLGEFNQHLRDFADRHLNSEGSKEYNVSYVPQSLRSIHLHSNRPYEMEANGDSKSVQFLWLVAILIILIAWANYINLATARAEERAEEIGVRKVIGADKKTLIAQFLTEAFLVNAIAITIAFVLIISLQPLMNNLVGKELGTIYEEPLRLLAITAMVLIFGTVISGLYPAFVLSNFSPARTIKAKAKNNAQHWFRKSLVTFQYVSSIVLIISTIIIFRQLNFMKKTDLGFSIDQKIVVNAPSVYNDSLQSNLYAAFRNRLLQDPAIANVSASSAIPGKYYYDLDSRGGIRMVGADENTAASFTSYRIDEDFIDTYGLQIIAGKDFSKETGADDRSFAVNEAALKFLGFTNPEDAIGKKILFQNEDRQMPITSVFKNYHHKSLRHEYEPTILWNFIPDPLYYTIKINPGSTKDMQTLIKKIESGWSAVFTENPFHYFFFDEQFNEQYEADNRLGTIIGVFSLFAVFIACLGLFGLTSYMITVRTKEIGIRKVLGSSISGIVTILTKDFITLVLLALFIAIPLSIYFGNKWLDNFAYKSKLDWWIFAMAGIIAISIAAITVSIQSIKAAMANPIDSLRNE